MYYYILAFGKLYMFYRYYEYYHFALSIASYGIKPLKWVFSSRNNNIESKYGDLLILSKDNDSGFIIVDEL